MSLTARSRKHSEAFHSEIVKRAILATTSRLDESFTLSSIAATAFVSRFHFNRVFRHVTGVPPCQFFYAMRIAQAKALLLSTRFKIIDVCYEVGYNSLGTFTRRFTELVGVSPSHFRSHARYWKERRIALLNCNPELLPSLNGPTLSGIVSAPEQFDGLIFVGLFTDPIPQGRPATCAIAGPGGVFHMHMGDLQKGTFYLFAMALPTPIDASTFFHAPAALRAGGQRITVSAKGVSGKTSLILRPPEIVDPPILIAIPPLLVTPLRDEPPVDVTDMRQDGQLIHHFSELQVVAGGEPASISRPVRL